MKRDIFEVQWDTACTALESKFSDNMIAGDSFLIVRALKAQLFEQNIILSDFTELKFFQIIVLYYFE